MAKIQNEVTNIKALITKYETVLNDKIEVFYDQRINSLKRLLNESNVLKKLPNSNKSEIGPTVDKNYEKIKKDLSKLLEGKIRGEVKFLASELNDKVTIGTVKSSGNEQFLLKKKYETDVNEFNSIYCSNDSILVEVYNKKTGRNEIKNLENNEIQKIDDNSFIDPIQNIILDKYGVRANQQCRKFAYIDVKKKKHYQNQPNQSSI